MKLIDVILIVLCSMVLLIAYLSYKSNKVIYITKDTYLQLNKEETSKHRRPVLWLVNDKECEEGYFISRNELKILLDYFEEREEKKTEKKVHVKYIRGIFEPIKQIELILKKLKQKY